MEQLTLRSGSKKAFILTLDAFLAVFLAVIIFISSAAYMSKKDNKLLDLQTEKTGSDLINLLDNSGVLESFSQSQIQNYADSIIPDKYGVRLNLTWTDNDLVTENHLEFGDALPEKKFVATGKKFFVVINSTEVKSYGLIKYYLWIK